MAIRAATATVADMQAASLAQQLVLSAPGSPQRLEVRQQLATDRALRAEVIDQLVVLGFAAVTLAPVGTAEVDDLSPFGELLASTLRVVQDATGGTDGTNAHSASRANADANVFALRNAILMHERIATQLGAVETLANFTAATLATAVAASPPATTLERLVANAVRVNAANMDGAHAPGTDPRFPWRTALDLVPLGRRRAAAVAAALCDPDGVHADVAAAVLDLLVGQLLDDELATAEVVDTLAELGALYPSSVFAPDPSESQQHAMDLAVTAAGSAPEAWQLRDELLASFDIDELVGLILSQTRLAATALLMRAASDDVPVDQVLHGLAVVWADQLDAPGPLLPAVPPPWLADDGLGGGAMGRALRLVAAEHDGDTDRCVHLVRPVAADRAAQLALVLSLVELAGGLLGRVGPDASVSVDDKAAPAVRLAAQLVNAAHPDTTYPPPLPEPDGVDAIELLRELAHLAAAVAAEAAALDDVEVAELLAELATDAP